MRTSGLSWAFVGWALQLRFWQVYLLPYTPQAPQMCQDLQTEYYDEAVDKCCRRCPPGSRVLQTCNESTETQCQPCEKGTYTKTWIHALHCFPCTSKCRKGFVQTKECTRTQDRFCWCHPNTFCTQQALGTCLMCQSYQQCQKGHGVRTPGTNSSDVTCAPCAPGTFSDVVSHNAICRPHQVCKVELVHGTSTNDAVCSDRGTSPHVTHSPPHSTAVVRRPPLLPVTRSPALDTDAILQNPSADISFVAGLVGGVTFGVFGLLVGIVSYCMLRKKAPPFGQKQPFTSIEKASDKWPQDTGGGLRQEEQNLLQISSSSSGSLDSPSGSEKSSGIISHESVLTTESERPQQRSPVLNSCSHYSRSGLKQSGSGGTHVNVNCIVSVCSSDHGLEFHPLGSSDFQAAKASGDGVSAAEDLPLSKEESALKKGREGQIAVEVEDCTAELAPEEKPVPLSIEDVGMKTR